MKWILVALLLLTPNLALAVTCGPVSGVVTLDQNLVISGNCFEYSSNTIIDGNGYTISGDGTGFGIGRDNDYEFHTFNITIKNIKVENFANGIELWYTENVTIQNITISTDNDPDKIINSGIVIYTSDNVTIKNSRVNIGYHEHQVTGISIQGSTKVNITNSTISMEENGLLSGSIWATNYVDIVPVEYTSAHTSITHNTLNGTIAGMSITGSNNTISNNNITGSNTLTWAGISSGEGTISNNILTISSANKGISATGNAYVNNNTITTSDPAVNRPSYGIEVVGTNVNMTNNTIISADHGIYSSTIGSIIFNNNSVTRTNTSKSEIYINSSPSSILFIDQAAGSLFINNATRASFRKTSMGEVNFTSGISGSINLSRDINISSNNITVNSSNTGFNKSANVTFYGLSTSMANPQIYRDGASCSSTICANLTSLNAGTVRINVTQWSSYYISDVPTDTCTPPALNNNWVISAADNCVKTGESINLGTGRVIITGNGYLRLTNTNLTVSDISVGNGSGLTRVILENSRLIRVTG